MGRSQVLYNRTKGRNKNRPGRGGNRSNDEYSSKSGSKGNHRQHSTGGGGHQIRHQQIPTRDSFDKPKDYEHEYELLFAGRSTYLSHSRSGRNDDDDDDGLVLGGNSNFGSICIPSMAATLEAMDITKRLRIPMRVAVRAFPEKVKIQQEEDNAVSTTKASNDDDDSSSRANRQSSSDPLSSNLEDWLDDACGIVGDSKAEDTGGTKHDASNDTHAENGAHARSTKSINNDGTGINIVVAENASPKTEEEYGEDSLDDWLDSMIE